MMDSKKRIKRLGLLMIVHAIVIPCAILLAFSSFNSLYLFTAGILSMWVWIYFIAGRIARKIREEKRQQETL